MTDSVPYAPSGDDLAQLQSLRTSVTDFRAMLEAQAPGARNLEYNQQFNELRSETRALLRSPFTEEVPRAITGDVARDRMISAIVIVGVILALVGLGINTIVLEDVLVNSLGCCISSGGMLLLVGALGVMLLRNYRERVTTVSELIYRVDLLLFQIDHRLAMSGVDNRPRVTPEPEVFDDEPPLGPPPASPLPPLPEDA